MIIWLSKNTLAESKIINLSQIKVLKMETKKSTYLQLVDEIAGKTSTDISAFDGLEIEELEQRESLAISAPDCGCSCSCDCTSCSCIVRF